MSLGGSKIGAVGGVPHYHLDRRQLRSSGLVLSGATISEKENQERKERWRRGC